MARSARRRVLNDFQRESELLDKAFMASLGLQSTYS